MPKIFDASPNVPGGQGVGRVSADRGFGSRLAGIGVAIEKFAGQLEEREQRADITRIHSLQSTAFSELTASVTEFEQSTELGAPGHVNRVSAFVRQYYEEREDQATTEAGRQLFQRKKAEAISHFTVKAIKFQAIAAGGKAKQDFLDGVNTDRASLYQNPDLFDELLKNALEKINDEKGSLAAVFNAQARRTLSRETEEEYTVAHIRGLIRRDPIMALAQIEEGVFNKTIDNGNEQFPGGSSKFFSFEEGDNKIRIVSPIEVFGQHYIQGVGYKVCVGKDKGCVYCLEGLKASPTYFCWVIDRNDGLIKEAKFSYTVLKSIDDVTAVEEYNFQPETSGIFPYDLNLRMIEGKTKNEKRSYNILPAQPTKLTAEENAKVAELEHPMKVIAKLKAEITGDEVPEDINVAQRDKEPALEDKYIPL